MPETFRPFEGVRIIDFSHVIAGPFATFHLAQMGADVLKVESPAGDVMRRGARGIEAFVALNAGKRKTRCDIKSAADRARIVEEIKVADVMVDNLRPGVLDTHGLGWSAMREVNPRLIYCAISGFGSTGTARGRPAYDHVVQAATGMTLTSGQEDDPPGKIGFPLIDAGAGIIGALAIASALRERERTGTGMLLDVSMAGAALQLMYPQTCDALTHGTAPKRQGNQAFSGSPAADLFRTRDGGWFAIAANTPRQFVSLLQVLGIPELGADTDLFETPVDPRMAPGFLHAKDPMAVKSRLAGAMATWEGAALEAALRDAKVPATRVRTLPDYAREADATGQLAGLDLDDEGVRLRSPGLGFRVLR